ncbi:DUF2267 domain-containing protein [Streptomyces griseoviridis]|uniref:Uncharacterized protein (DUF2267 family) n=1 Tax=Streptomyces griseoviridis TaxID=45398 RepID=A0ABT9LE93_STRGD|nr:DUF2267 domain-containing protein [Streptomyces griseoviridis]MDP9682032.1 uncharacterized protein (DUF2267 family) [Streptomyces griseoviridis]GGT02955.1 hypothetical protein GCM10010240_40430 [Streptomyces griseoviridis]
MTVTTMPSTTATPRPAATTTPKATATGTPTATAAPKATTAATPKVTAPRTPAPAEAPAGTRPAWAALVEEVREAGRYPTRAEAERVTRIVLSALGGHVIGDERVDLAQALPEEAARVVASQIPATRPLTAAEFVDSVAARIEGATPATARWDVSSVLSVLPSLVGDDLITRVLDRLPSGYALLFGRADLTPAA